MPTNWNPGGVPNWGRLSGDLAESDDSVVVLVDDSANNLTAFFKSEVESLPDTVESRLIKVPLRPGSDAILSALRDALISLIPEIGPEFSALSPRKWVAEIKSQSADNPIENRWILIDQFHHVLEAPAPEKRLVVDILEELAGIPTFGVVVGIVTEKAREMAVLFRLIEDEGEAVGPVADPPSVRRGIPNWLSAACVIFGIGGVAFGLFARLESRAASTPEVFPGLELNYLGESDESETGVGKLPVTASTLTETRQFSNAPLPPAVIDSIDPAGHAGVGITGLATAEFAGEDLAGFGITHLRKEWNFSPDEEVPEADLLYFVAEAYCFGHGVETDLSRGISLLEAAVEKGSEKAANLLGTCFARGLGVSQDYEQALSLYETALGGGSIYAHGNLGVIYLRGLGCDPQPDRALESFVAGAGLGDPVAAFFAARCFEKGIGNATGEPNREKAVFYYLESARQGHPEALEWCRSRNLLPSEFSLPPDTGGSSSG